MATDPAQAG